MAQATVKTEQIADGAITAAKIADGAIVAAELASNSVTTAKIADDAVTSAKLDTNIAIAGTLDVAGAVVFNEGSADVDFRVESNGNANMLFVDGGNDRVGIGHSAPLFPLHKKTTTGYIMSETTDSSASAGYRLKADASADFTLFTTQGTNQFAIYDNANTAERLRIDSSGNVGIGANTSPVASASAYNTAALHLHQSQSGSYGSQIHLTNAATGAAAGDGSFISQWSDQSLYITNQENANIAFSANGSERMRIRASGDVAIGSAGYDGQRLAINSGTGDNVLYGESTDANCFASFRDNSSSANITFGAIGNSHVFRKDSTEYMRIDANGHITAPHQSAFEATKSADQSNIAVSGNVGINFDNEIFDQNADYNTNGNFTAPVTGRYQLNMSLTFQDYPSNAAYLYGGIITSNRTYYLALNPTGAASSNYECATGSILADMDAGDTAYVFVLQGGGSANTDVLQHSWFSGFLVC
jgi:hypothetical protein